MAFRELQSVEIKNVLRRLKAGHSMRAIARQTATDRKTLKRYSDVLEASATE
ncbi:MAG: helix-turn-helix domain-containing protein [Myxococcota bacterium]